jgi:hypothetical protein
VTRNREKEFKEFMISSRKSIGAGYTNAPVWILRKAGKRIWNPKQKRHWKNVDMGDLYRNRQKKKKSAKRRQDTRKTKAKKTGKKKN